MKTFCVVVTEEDDWGYLYKAMGPRHLSVPSGAAFPSSSGYVEGNYLQGYEWSMQ